jgi:hypothetical protein
VSSWVCSGSGFEAFEQVWPAAILAIWPTCWRFIASGRPRREVRQREARTYGRTWKGTLLTQSFWASVFAGNLASPSTRFLGRRRFLGKRSQQSLLYLRMDYRVSIGWIRYRRAECVCRWSCHTEPEAPKSYCFCAGGVFGRVTLQSSYNACRRNTVPDILAMLVSERDKLNRAIEALSGEIGYAIIRVTKTGPVGPRPGGTRGIRKGRSGPKPGQHFHTAASRAKIAAAQRARWAKRKVKSAVVEVARSAKRFTQSAEAKAKISKAMKARWAKKKTS